MATFESVVVPTGRTLFIHPPYVHDDYLANDTPFRTDRQPFIPNGPLYAAELLERHGLVQPEFIDCQLHDLRRMTDIEDYDSFAIGVMGAQNISPGVHVLRYLSQLVDPARIFVGGQGIERMTADEFQRVFPGANQVQRYALANLPGAMDVVLDRQLSRLPQEDVRTYLSNEMTLLFSQGCLFGCTFCGAQTQQRESFFNTAGNLDMICGLAKRFGLESLDFYCTSLDFFQQALPGGNLGMLTSRLEGIIELQERHGMRLTLKALCRADSYNAAMRSETIRDLVRRAGFNRFGFGADGAASAEIVRSMRKHADHLRSDLLEAFADAEAHDVVPQILYVFGIAEDTEETLAATRDLCGTLLETFPTCEYRGFPAKNEIPGNANWKKPAWRQSRNYNWLLDEPDLFLNLGFETLANEVSHDDPKQRRLVNQFAVDMSLYAHELGRAQSYLTVPIISGDDGIMDDTTMAKFREIVANYAPDVAPHLDTANLPSYRRTLNAMIPKDA